MYIYIYIYIYTLQEMSREKIRKCSLATLIYSNPKHEIIGKLLLIAWFTIDKKNMYDNHFPIKKYKTYYLLGQILIK